MPLLNSLATPYAEALLQVTEARGESETVADQCKQLLAIWNDSEDFRDAMVSPVLEPDAKKQALRPSWVSRSPRPFSTFSRSWRIGSDSLPSMR